MYEKLRKRVYEIIYPGQPIDEQPLTLDHCMQAINIKSSEIAFLYKTKKPMQEQKEEVLEKLYNLIK